jgi:hypothetical protein
LLATSRWHPRDAAAVGAFVTDDDVLRIRDRSLPRCQIIVDGHVSGVDTGGPIRASPGSPTAGGEQFSLDLDRRK